MSLGSTHLKKGKTEEPPTAPGLRGLGETWGSGDTIGWTPDRRGDIKKKNREWQIR